MSLRTRLTEKLDIQHPILSAPMGFVSGGRLAGAVTEAGGLGLLGGGYGEEDWLAREFQAAGNHRVGCGFITWSLARNPRLLDLVLERAPAAVMLSFGDPRPFAPRILQNGTILICQVQNRDHALAALDAGAAVIVAQGSEAGGHGALRATLPLVPAIADLVARRAPEAIVVAAGGIADGRGLAAALMLGAEGVLVGTRFYASAEALGHAGAKARIVQASGDNTRRTSVFDVVRGYDWPEEFSGRALHNDFMARWHGREAELAAALDREQPHYREAVEAGDFSTGLIFAGECVDLIGDLPSAGEIVTRMAAEAESALASGHRRIV